MKPQCHFENAAEVSVAVINFLKQIPVALFDKEIDKLIRHCSKVIEIGGELLIFFSCFIFLLLSKLVKEKFFFILINYYVSLDFSYTIRRISLLSSSHFGS